MRIKLRSKRTQAWKALLLKLDWILLLTTFLLMVIGVFFVYSAGYQREDLFRTDYQKQLIWCLIGFVAFFIACLTHYEKLSEYAGFIYLGAAILLGVVFLLPEVNNAHRWIRVGGINLQPSELGKLATLISVAAYLSRKDFKPDKPSQWLPTIGIVGFPFVLILLEPDLGTAMVLVPITFMMLFAAKLPWKWILLMMVLGVFIVMPAGYFALNEYQQTRIQVFLNPNLDPSGSGWNRLQSEAAVGSGGLKGKGYLNGTQNILGFLPRTVAPTDFIFSVIAEETGFIGSILLLGLFTLLVLRIGRAAYRAPDPFGRYLCMGVLGMIFFHVFVNIAMTIGLMPITGLPLPLISYGGSFMVSTMLALGITQSVYVRRRER